VKIYKFKIPANAHVPLRSDPTAYYAGCLAVVSSTDEETARKRIVSYATELGLDARWLEVARVETIDPNGTPTVLAFVMQ